MVSLGLWVLLWRVKIVVVFVVEPLAFWSDFGWVGWGLRGTRKR